MDGSSRIDQGVLLRQMDAFVNFYTLTLPSEYGIHPRKTLPVSMSTMMLYLSHLSQEGEVREGSLNPYLAVVNQMHQDA
jgi:hypothetical protein